MTGVRVVKKKVKHHRTTEIVIGFSGAINATEAQEPGIYRLARRGKHGSFTARNSKVFKLRSVWYDPAGDTVTLIPKKRFTLAKKIQLQVNGLPPSGLEDSSDRYIDGNRDGQAGGNAIAILSRRGVAIDAIVSGTSGGQTAANPVVIDALLEHDELPGVTSAHHHRRAAQLEAP
jgi:hypothetical protein